MASKPVALPMNEQKKVIRNLGRPCDLDPCSLGRYVMHYAFNAATARQDDARRSVRSVTERGAEICHAMIPRRALSGSANSKDLRAIKWQDATFSGSGEYCPALNRKMS
jgi:hypothetical protein